MTEENNAADPTTLADTTPSVEATLSASDLDDLFRDLAVCAEIQHITVKHAPDQRFATPTAPDLAAARVRLDQPQTHAVQLRYNYDGAHWIDTVTRTSTAFQLRRIRLDL